MTIRSAPDGDLWARVDGLLASASPDGARLHGLAPLEAVRLERMGQPVPKMIVLEARMAAFAMLSAAPLLERVRDGCDGPLVLMKGPEVAVHYPSAARNFVDIDLLTANPDRTHTQLREVGFLEIGDDDLFRPHHHLRPLKWPGLPLLVEIHGKPHFPGGLEAPAAASIIEAAVPSQTHVAGILTPELSQHVLLLVAHAWAHDPLYRLRDLIDVRALASPTMSQAIERTAQEWGMRRLWRTTEQVTDAVLSRQRLPPFVGLWAGHLAELRERTVLENHLREWLAAYWALPLPSAVATTARAAWNDIAPAPEEGWSDKLSRALAAARNATTPLSQHNRRLGDAATRGRNRNRQRDDQRRPS